MAVPDRVREIESEIDTDIRQLPIWRAPRADVLNDLMRTYRDAIECIFLRVLHAEIFDSSRADFGAHFVEENRIRAGILWALKWASEYCPVSGTPATRSPEELLDLIFIGATYEAWVDALKYAQHDLITVQVDEVCPTVTFYEGGPATPFDVNILDHQRITTPHNPHVSFTEAGDQLTSRWMAGDYRRVAKRLASYAEDEENTICLALAS